MGRRRTPSIWPPPRRSTLIVRIVKWVGIGALGIALAVIGRNVWSYSERVYEIVYASDLTWPGHDPDAVLESLADGNATIGLLPGSPPSLTAEGRFGVSWEGTDGSPQHGVLGAVTGATDGAVTREFVSVDGDPVPGTPLHVTGYAFAANPRVDVLPETTTVNIRTDLGAFPATQLDGDDTWVIVVHGRGEGREAANRILPVASELGYSALSISYRNDPETIPDGTGLPRFGLTEWNDLHHAVRYTDEARPRRTILVGFGTGGSIVVEFMLESSRADHIDGIVLDSPVLDLGALVADRANAAGIPDGWLALAKQVASLRFDLRWSELDYLSRIDNVTVPVLLFHGAANEHAPIEVTDAAVERLGDLVTYVRSDEAGHVESWSFDRVGYEQALRVFFNLVSLERITSEPAVTQ